MAKLTSFFWQAASRSKLRQTQTGAVVLPAAEVEIDRKTLAQELGYRSIGADLPDNVSLGSIISSLPAEVCGILSSIVADQSPINGFFMPS